MRAIWKGTTIAESDDIVEVEGNAYFPHDALRPEHFKPSDTHTTCPWKGRASYYDVVVGEGGYAALRGHGGATARIVVGGVLRVGDTVNLDVESTVG